MIAPVFLEVIKTLAAVGGIVLTVMIVCVLVGQYVGDILP